MGQKNDTAQLMNVPSLQCIRGRDLGRSGAILFFSKYLSEERSLPAASRATVNDESAEHPSSPSRSPNDLQQQSLPRPLRYHPVAPLRSPRARQQARRHREANVSDAKHEPFARSPAFSHAIFTDSTRDICPAPTPTVLRPFARTMALDLTEHRNTPSKIERVPLIARRRPFGDHFRASHFFRSKDIVCLPKESTRYGPHIERRSGLRRRARTRESAADICRKEPEVLLRPQNLKGSIVKTRGHDAFKKGLHQKFRKRCVHRPIESNDATKGTHRISFTRISKRFNDVFSNTCPARVLCLMIVAAGV